MGLSERIKEFLYKYEKYLYKANIKMPAVRWILIAFIFSVLLLFVGFLLFGDLLLGIILFLVSLDLIVGYPYFLEKRRIRKIEEEFPDILREMSANLKSGGSFEYALKEVALTRGGDIQELFLNVVRRLEEGETIEEALNYIVEEVDSPTIKKTIGIMVDTIKLGGKMADVLEDLAEDSRQINMLYKERKARTTLQVLFIFFAGVVIAPMIFGMLSVITNFFVNVSTSLAGGSASGYLETNEQLVFFMRTYVSIEVIISSIIISLMREGKPTSAVVYIPIFLFVSYISFVVGKIFFSTILGGI